MSDYAQRIMQLNTQISGWSDDIAAAATKRIELQSVRNNLVTKKETLETNKELLDNPETGESGSTGSHANNHEESERGLVKNSHTNLPEQVQEMIDAIDSKRDDLQDLIDMRNVAIEVNRSSISAVREKQRQANNN